MANPGDTVYKIDLNRIRVDIDSKTVTATVIYGTVNGDGRVPRNLQRSRQVTFAISDQLAASLASAIASGAATEIAEFLPGATVGTLD